MAADKFVVTEGILVGNSTVNATINSTAIALNGVPFSGGGYFKGNRGTIGGALNIGDIFRVNSDTLTQDVTIVANTNGHAAGPVNIAVGVTLTIETGARVSIT